MGHSHGFRWGLHPWLFTLIPSWDAVKLYAKYVIAVMNVLLREISSTWTICSTQLHFAFGRLQGCCQSDVTPLFDFCFDA
jgi:hypothetical protein